jgi:Fe2+ transport system protein FeoA
MRCQLCGYKFDATTMACHNECPMGQHCTLICCPNCGYQVVDESKSVLAKVLQRLWPASIGKQAPWQPKKLKSEPSGAPIIPLNHIPAGRVVEVKYVEALSAQRLAQLSLLGLTPGARVEILQHRPTPIIRIGETELALANELLAQIWVQ